ncbi:uncharacterized protein [Symphalangus syndactylus]|uniref:uncharacterized protein n=1 Tax=Symphalangus syndactylus TaxID=9590 RepID=UPI0024414BE4|nr:uncharacterized protein LOC129492991 [Symphalangus syndactylus]
MASGPVLGALRPLAALTLCRRPTRSVLDTLPPSLASTPLRTLQLRGPGAGIGRARARAGPQGTCPAHTRSRTGDFSRRTKKEIEGLRRVGLEPKSPTHLTPPHPPHPTPPLHSTPHIPSSQPFLPAGASAAVRAPPRGLARGPRLTRRPGAE